MLKAIFISTLLFMSSISFAQKTNESKDIFVARVIFAEAMNCSPEERVLVASVMQGRIEHKGFANGTLHSMYDVASQKNAFSCVNDKNNKNWAKSANPDALTDKEKLVWQHCLSLAKGGFQQALGQSGEPLVYYHDHTISRPVNWSKYWNVKLEVSSKHFEFYSISPK